jgi:hypothetical protein
MKRRVLLVSLLLAIAAPLAGAAQAQNQLGGRAAVTIDPQKSYIFFRAPEKIELIFLRQVTPEQLPLWRAARAEALRRAVERYSRAQLDYDRAVRACEGRPQPCLTVRRPTPVTEENFYYPPPETAKFVPVSTGPQFTQAEGGGYTYLIEVPPGIYTLYGSVTSGSYGLAGFCLCMGSLRFETRAGQIADVGEIRYAADEARQVQHLPTVGRVRSIEIVPYAPTMTRPAQLANLPVAPAVLRAADKLPNYLGVFIDRHPAVPGLLRYARDRVIDDRTGQAAAP